MPALCFLLCHVPPQLDIELAGNIVVLDEAHNIEDSARDAASFSFTTEDLEKAQVNLAKLGKDWSCTVVANEIGNNHFGPRLRFLGVM